MHGSLECLVSRISKCCGCVSMCVCVLWMGLSSTRLIEFQIMLTYQHTSTFCLHNTSERFVFSS